MITFDFDTKTRKGLLLCEQPTFGMIRNHFSMKKAGSFYLKKVNKNIPDRDYAIQTNGLFDFGMFSEISKFLVSRQITEIEYTPEFEERNNIGYPSVSVSGNLEYDLRDYQEDALSKAFSVGCGTIIVGTGGGKSLLQSNLLENYKTQISDTFKCLLIVPGLSLVNQLLENFEEYGVTFTYSGWTGGTQPQDTNVIVANSENLCSQFPNFKWLVDIDLVLNDECHKCTNGSQLSKILQKIKTPHKFGFTGTLPKSDIDKWKIIGTFGPVIYEKKSKSLRDEGFLTNATVKIIKLNHSVKPKKGYPEELEFIQESPPRNQMIKKLVGKLDKNVLILVNRLDHGFNLIDHISFENREVFFINGDMSVPERQEIISKMESQNNIVCIAMSAIFSTGINIKNLPYIMFVSGGKSFIRTIQSIGRGLRLHDNKEQLVLFDITDNMKYSMNHLVERKKFYDEEELYWREIELNLL